jgi:hypothetical protein
MWNCIFNVHCAAKDINYFEDSSLQGSDAISGGRVFPGTGLLGPAFLRSIGNNLHNDIESHPRRLESAAASAL